MNEWAIEATASVEPSAYSWLSLEAALVSVDSRPMLAELICLEETCLCSPQGWAIPPNTAAHAIGVVQLHAIQLFNDDSSYD